MLDKLGKWGSRVGLKALGTFGLVLVGGVSAALATNGVSGMFSDVMSVVEVAAGAACVKVVLPALTSLLKRAEAVEPGEAPDDVFGSITDDA